MRLIDADKLRQKDMNGEMVDIFSVLEAPTVKAIPIDWIEKQMTERENYGDFNTASAIGYLLLSWEEENEQAN